MTMKEARKRAKLRQADVADALGINIGRVASWDTGRALPRAAMLPEIAKLYGCTIEELLSGKGGEDCGGDGSRQEAWKAPQRSGAKERSDAG